MAKEFARALQQLPEGAEEEAGDPDSGSGDDWADPGSGGDQLGAGAFGSSPPRSSPGAGAVPGPSRSHRPAGSRSGRGRTASPSRLGTGPTGSGGGPASRQRSPLTRHGNRGLLDQLEEALAASLDPTVLTGGLRRAQEGKGRVRCCSTVRAACVGGWPLALPSIGCVAAWKLVNCLQEIEESA